MKLQVAQIEERLKDRPVGAIGGRRYFSILIPLLAQQDGIYVLFEQRSKKMKTQPGDVCFPGGRMEPGETPLACALRETQEEIGIAPEEIRILGQYDSLYEIAGITMRTFVGILPENALQKLRCNPAEVEQAFVVPLSYFMETKPKIYESQIVQKVDDFPYAETGIRPDYKWRTGKNEIPIYRYEGHIIWGLTGRIIKWFAAEMAALFCPASCPEDAGDR